MKILKKASVAFCLLITSSSIWASEPGASERILKTGTLQCWGTSHSSQAEFHIKVYSKNGKSTVDVSELEKVASDLKLKDPTLDIDSCLESAQYQITRDPGVQAFLTETAKAQNIKYSTARSRAIYSPVFQIRARITEKFLKKNGFISISAPLQCNETQTPRRRNERGLFRNVHFRIDADSPPNLQSTQLNGLLDELSKKPDIDFFACLTALQNRLQARVSRNAYLRTARAKPALIEANNALLTAVTAKINAYGEKIKINETRQPVVAGGKLVSDLQPEFDEAPSDQLIATEILAGNADGATKDQAVSAQFAEHLPQILDNLSRSDAKNLQTHLNDTIQQSSPQLKDCVKGSACAESAEAAIKAQQVVNKIAAGHLGKSEKIKDNGSICAECDALKGGATPLKLPRLSNIDLSSCTQLKVGDSQTVDGTSPPLLPRFNLKRVSDDLNDHGPVYQASINIRFTNLSGQLDTAIADHFKSCMDGAAPALNGPNGEHLRIKMWSTGDSAVAPKVVSVKVTPPSKNGGTMVRQDMENWTDNMDCGIVIHETMHMLGLVDLYQESISGTWVDASGNEIEHHDFSGGVTSKGSGETPPRSLGTKFLSTYDCRNPGPNDSIMTDYKKAAEQSFPGHGLFLCSCSTDSPHGCDAQLRALTGIPASCPSKTISSNGATVLHADLNGTDGAYESLRPYENGFYKDYSYRYVKPYPPKRDSLLYPAEFRMIVYPGCEAANKTYNACAAASYTTSKTNDPKQQNDCPISPPICKDAKAWLQ